MNKEKAQSKIEELEEELESLKKIINGPEHNLKKGDLIEVWNNDIPPKYPLLKRFHSIDKQGSLWNMDEDGYKGYFWDNYRPLKQPNTWIDWSGGECPEEVKLKITIVEYEDGSFGVRRCGGDFYWNESGNSTIVKYMVIEE